MDTFLLSGAAVVAPDNTIAQAAGQVTVTGRMEWLSGVFGGDIYVLAVID